ncbi:MAG: hypothetical protein CM1200mP39_06140 [Dehalococcoidia bacterium]|nr:MAG: hypothetical protein CM1200mP39_06140 [Dehalococcoidia bacterium]
MDITVPDYIHLLAEALKISFSDRDAFYGDPDFIDVPMRGSFKARRMRRVAELISTYPERRRRCLMQVIHGLLKTGQNRRIIPISLHSPIEGDAEPDTSYASVIDRWGNMFSATPSDGATAVVPSLGFTPSTRGSQSWLDENHPSVIAPWKRPGSDSQRVTWVQRR